MPRKESTPDALEQQLRDAEQTAAKAVQDVEQHLHVIAEAKARFASASPDDREAARVELDRAHAHADRLQQAVADTAAAVRKAQAAIAESGAAAAAQREQEAVARISKNRASLEDAERRAIDAQREQACQNWDREQTSGPPQLWFCTDFWRVALEALRQPGCPADRKRLAEIEQEWKNLPVTAETWGRGGVGRTVVFFWSDIGQIVENVILTFGGGGGLETDSDLNRRGYSFQNFHEARKRLTEKRFGRAAAAAVPPLGCDFRYRDINRGKKMFGTLVLAE